VREHLARGLFITLLDAKVEDNLARRDALLGELRALASAYPDDAPVREQLALGLFEARRDAKAGKTTSPAVTRCSMSYATSPAPIPTTLQCASSWREACSRLGATLKRRTTSPAVTRCSSSCVPSPAPTQTTCANCFLDWKENDFHQPSATACKTNALTVVVRST